MDENRYTTGSCVATSSTRCAHCCSLGSLLVGQGEEEAKALRNREQSLKAAEVEAVFLNAEDAMDMEPSVRIPHGGGALLIPRDAQIDASLAVEGMLQVSVGILTTLSHFSTITLGVALLTYDCFPFQLVMPDLGGFKVSPALPPASSIAYKVKSFLILLHLGDKSPRLNNSLVIIRSDLTNKVTGVQTSHCKVNASKAIIMAAGAWSAPLMASLSLETPSVPPIKPRKVIQLPDLA